MNAQEFVLRQLVWLQTMYEESKDSETRERLITAIQDIVIAALGEGAFSSSK